VNEAITAVRVVEEVKKWITGNVPQAITFFSVNDEWVYTAVMDNVVCPECLKYEDQIFMGNTLRALFPYLEIQDLETILPNVHPNCRCHLDRILYLGDIGVERK
jgi:hypothetical protein